MHERIFGLKQLFWQYLTSVGLIVDLRSLLMKTLSKEEFKSYRLVSLAFFYLSQLYFTDATARFLKKYNHTYRILTFDDLWWPQYCYESKNDRNIFKSTYWELLNTFNRVFLILLVFGLQGGGYISPPLWRSWQRPPLNPAAEGCAGRECFCWAWS